MDLRQLRYFTAVASTLNFGRAARELSIAQPPLSRAIRGLEEELGVSLFDRGPRGVALTDAGRALAPEARRLLRDAEAFRDDARGYARGEAGSLSIGFVSAATYNVMPRLIGAWRARRPGVRMVLREAASDAVSAGLASAELDLGLVVTALDPSMATLPLHTEPMVAALPTGRRWPARIDARTLVREPFILFPRSAAPSMHDDILAWCREGGREPTIAQEALQMQTIVGLVAAGIGVALVPESLKQLARRGVVYRPLAERPPAVEIALAWRRADDSPLVQAFVGEARALAPSTTRSK